MKVLHVITSLCIGEAEKLLVDTIPIYNKKGVETDVLVFQGRQTPFRKQLEEQGCRVFQLSEDRNVYNPINIIKIIPYLKKYDVVHTHNTASQLFVAIASVLCSVVLCTTEHTTSNRRRSWKWYVPIDRFMYQRYKHIICISDKTEENLRNYIGDVAIGISTIYNGVDVTKYFSALANPAFKRNGSKYILCMVAGFRYQKDQDTIIRAFRFLDKSLFELWLVGDGERRAALEQLVEAEGIKDNVRFWGIRTNIPEIMKTADVVVMSSHWEGFGLAAVEGMAAGKPVIASDIDGLSQVVDGAGLLFPKGDEKALASCILEIYEDKDYYQRLSELSVERAKEFDLSHMVNQYIKIYHRITE